MFHKLVAAATGASMMLSAVPAFAMEVDLDTSADVSVTSEVEVENSQPVHPIAVGVLKRAKRGSDTDGSRELKRKCADAESVTDCEEKMKAKVNANANGSSHANFRAKISDMTDEEREEHFMTRIMKTVKRAVHHLSRLTKRLCSIGATDLVSADECVQKMGTNIKTRIGLMIDEAFGIDA